ncbi:MAG TPA: oxygenase MpaB family protein, partial [Pseudomonadales bacterium]|nr:oxygenase MpaB family protein [Pseudomonadales bacterium]
MNFVPTAVAKRFVDPRQGKEPRLVMLGRVLIREKTKVDEAHIKRYQAALYQGDPLADNLVLAMKEMPAGAGRKMFNQALDNGIETIENPPPAFVEFFKQIDTVPLWFNRALANQGCRAAMRSGPLGEYVLNGLSLMGSYRAAPAVKPLVYTGALKHSAYRRLVETSSFWVDVTRPNNLGRFQDGFKSAVRVRLMHAMVRMNIARSDKWDWEDWGSPINQGDMCATNMLFSVA